MQLEQFSAVELGQKIAQGEFSSREVTGYFLERIARLDGQIGSMLSISPESAQQQAASVDARISQGEQLGPLAGVPITVKDVLCVQGVTATCGSKMLKDYQPPYTATSIQRLLDAGMVLLGKTNMDEFAMGSSTENSAFGVTRNPWDLDRTPGGSSGGAAAALAAGLTPLSIGSDTGGSVRQPAAFCGVCGFKPTYGLVSRYGLIAYASSLDQVGPMAHHVQDLAAILQLMAGHDPRDSTSLEVPIPDYSASLSRPLDGLRVGLVSEHQQHPSLDPEIAAAVQRTEQLLRSLGAIIEHIHLPHSRHSAATYYVIAPCEASSNLARYEAAHYGFRASAKNFQTAGQSNLLEQMMIGSRSAGFGEEVKRRIMLGTFALSAGYSDAFYKQALKVRRLIANDYLAAFKQVDVLLGPAFPTPAFRLGEKINDPVQTYLADQFTVEANLAGLPAMSLPAGFSQAGLPLAIQLQAPHLQESRLLNIGFQLQLAGLFTPRVASLASAGN
jgi:aspartyl-tRNA(Asn)/glutamyl-tRNA(Gln) amidotransferase subunit A